MFKDPRHLAAHKAERRTAYQSANMQAVVAVRAIRLLIGHDALLASLASNGETHVDPAAHTSHVLPVIGRATVTMPTERFEA